MKKVWYVFGGLALLIVIGFAGGTYGMGAVKRLKIANVDLGKVTDGVHEGTFKQARWNYTVAVTVKDHKITAVELLNPKDAPSQKLFSAQADRVVKAQSPNVDTVSGATVSGKALLKAIENALTK